MSDNSNQSSSQLIVSKRGGQHSRNTKRKRGIASLFTWKWFTIVMITTLLLVVAACSAIMVYGEIIDFNKIDNINSPSYMTDINGKEVEKLGDVKREWMDLKDIEAKNKMLIDAIIKVEDVRFFKHGGVDFWSMGRAVWSNITRRRLEGGGTITMQVARNLIIENRDQNILRKLKEMGTAWNIERNCDKSKILTLYLNTIDFGPNINGVGMAAKVYFNKDLRTQKLDSHEVALLVGLPKAPGAYYPFGTDKNKDNALKRRSVVLKIMSTQNEMPPLITEDEATKAKEKPLISTEEGKKYLPKNNKFAAYKQFVIAELKSRYGVELANLKSNKYIVHTGLDRNAQIATEESLRQELSKKEDVEGGTVTIDVKSKLIAAIGGGKDFKPGDLIKGTQEPKPTGSAIKPLTVFAPAIEKGMNAASIVEDRDPNLGGWHPKNFDGKEYGSIPMIEVVRRSLNLGTLWILKNKVGLTTSYNTGEKLGLELGPNDKKYSVLGMGAFEEKGETALQMAGAYTAFVNKGNRFSANSISKVEVVDKGVVKVLSPKDENKSDEPVFSESTVNEMNSMLQTVVQNGTGKNARLAGGRPVAGKSGTTNGSKEAWFVGYTPEGYITAVCTSSKLPAPKTGDLVSGAIPQRIFAKIMNEAHSGKPFGGFAKSSADALDPEQTDENALAPSAVMAPNIKSSFDEKNGVVRLSWQLQDSTIRYKVERSIDNGPAVVLTEASLANSYSDQIDPTLLRSGKVLRCSYKVTAIGGDGSAHQAAGLTVVINSGGRPSPPPVIPPKPGEDGRGDGRDARGRYNPFPPAPPMPAPAIPGQ